MSVIQYTGVEQQMAMRNTKGACTKQLATQKLATLYCPFCGLSGRGNGGREGLTVSEECDWCDLKGQ